MSKGGGFRRGSTTFFATLCGYALLPGHSYIYEFSRPRKLTNSVMLHFQLVFFLFLRYIVVVCDKVAIAKVVERVYSYLEILLLNGKL